MWVYPAGMCVACHLVDDNVIIHHMKSFVNTCFLFFSHIFDKLCMYIFSSTAHANLPSLSSTPSDNTDAEQRNPTPKIW